MLELTRVASKDDTRYALNGVRIEEVTVVARAGNRERRALRFGGVSSVPPADEAQNPRCRLRKRMRCIVWWAVRATFAVVVI